MVRKFIFGAVLAITAALWSNPAWAQCGSSGSTHTLTDSAGYRWDIQDNGTIWDGTSDAYDTGMALNVGGSYFPASAAVSELAGRQWAFGPAVMSGLRVTRRVYVPATDAWARFLEEFNNPTAAPITVTVRIETNAGSDGGTNITASFTGDLAFTVDDRWLCTDDSDGSGDPSLGHNFWGEGATLRPTAVSMAVFDCAAVNGPNVQFSLTVPAGQTLYLMHFGSQNTNQATARATSVRLDGEPEAILFGLADVVVAGIQNWLFDRDLDDDGFNVPEDCNDEDPDINPDADEVCDGVDNDCNDEIDEPGAIDGEVWYPDADGDGFGDGDLPTRLCEPREGYTDDDTDCDDEDPDIFPGSDEFCDGIDNDCDGSIDEGLTDTYYPDLDGDGYGDSSRPTELCEPREGYTEDHSDCDDSDMFVNPDGVEVCDGVDDDCDGTIDDGVSSTYYPDIDGDGFGDPAHPREACSLPYRHVENDDDCDDARPTVNPDGTESCNHMDDDCDGETDEGLLTTYWLDSDRDGYGDPEAATDACMRPPGHVDNDDDCDDSDRMINPDGRELCDGIDNDCDGDIDDGLPGTTYHADADGDGHGDPDTTEEACALPEGFVANATDCDDSDPDINPEASEACNEVDDDCDGVVDEGATTQYWTDADGDGYGDPDASVSACEMPDDAVDNSGDCDDTDAAVNPDADEACNGVDDDCNGVLDDGAPTQAFYLDDDGDGAGDPEESVDACAAPEGYVDNSDDCDDADENVFPGADEACNEIDDDCDGEIDEDLTTETFYADADDDGYGDPATSLEACVAPEGTTDDASDCDDTDDAVNPGATEIENLIDDNCDGEIDEGFEEEGCACNAAGSAGRTRLGLFRLLLSWIGLV
jgi:hypothetical protein